jgi:hypothetical protein
MTDARGRHRLYIEQSSILSLFVICPLSFAIARTELARCPLQSHERSSCADIPENLIVRCFPKLFYQHES